MVMCGRTCMVDGDVGDGDDDDVDGDGDGRLDGDVGSDLSTSTSTTTASHLEAFELPAQLNLDILLKTKIFSSKICLTMMSLNLLTAVLSEGRGSVALKSDSLEAQQGPKLHLDLYFILLFLFFLLFMSLSKSSSYH